MASVVKVVVHLFVAVTLSLTLYACDHSHTLQQNSAQDQNNPQGLSQLDQKLRTLIEDQQLSGTPSARVQPTDVNAPLSQLGMKLFFSQTNNPKSENLACVHCHHPLKGGGDELSMPLIELPIMPYTHRNSSSSFNSMYWKKRLFHDGRIEFYTGNKPSDDQLKRWQQAPSDPPVLHYPRTRYVKQYPRQWLPEFRTGFNDPTGTEQDLLTEENVDQAISSYLRSQNFINTPWADYIKGDSEAITRQAKEGALLFYRKPEDGGYACAQCHSGDFFTDEQLHNTLMPPIGNKPDYGRWHVTRQFKDRYRFKTPTLLNTEMTGPWGHNGAYTTLANAVRHMLNPEYFAKKYDHYQLLQDGIAIENYEEQRPKLLKTQTDLTVPDSYANYEVQQLVAFLLTLTDPCLKDEGCIKQWLPEGYPTP